MVTFLINLSCLWRHDCLYYCLTKKAALIGNDSELFLGLISQNAKQIIVSQKVIEIINLLQCSGNMIPRSTVLKVYYLTQCLF